MCDICDRSEALHATVLGYLCEECLLDMKREIAERQRAQEESDAEIPASERDRS